MKAVQAVSLALWSLFSALPARASAGAVTLRGRLVDGTAMVRSLSPESIHSHGQASELFKSAQRLPLKSRAFRLHLLEGPHQGRSWEGSTNEEGRFTLTLDVPGLPSSPCLVARVEGSPPSFSAAVAPSEGEVEFRAFAVTSSERFLKSNLDVRYSLVENPALDRLDLEARVQVIFFNGSGEMYIGRPGRRGGEPSSREILRVPLPAGASVLLNQGPRGEKWAEVREGRRSRWMAIHSPILPVVEDPRGVWELVYRVKARQKLEMVYPVPFEISLFAAWGREDQLVIESARLVKEVPPESMKPDAGKWAVHVASEVEAGRDIPLGIHIDNVTLGQVNRGSLLLMSLFLLAAVGAILSGLLLGRARGAVDPVLEEATGDEIIARIADLDARHEAGKISPEEYRPARAKLLSLARYMVPELGGSPGEPSASLPPAVRAILERLSSLEAAGPLDSQRIQERLILLEELRKALEASLGRRER